MKLFLVMLGLASGGLATAMILAAIVHYVPYGLAGIMAVCVLGALYMVADIIVNP